MSDFVQYESVSSDVALTRGYGRCNVVAVINVNDNTEVQSDSKWLKKVLT